MHVYCAINGVDFFFGYLSFIQKRSTESKKQIAILLKIGNHCDG